MDGIIYLPIMVQIHEKKECFFNFYFNYLFYSSNKHVY